MDEMMGFIFFVIIFLPFLALAAHQWATR